MKNLLLLLIAGSLVGCTSTRVEAPFQKPEAPFMWENATIYFLLTDRFQNGDPSNDVQLGRQPDGAPLRSFMGGDFAGIIEKIEEGYFDSLGVNALWMNPPVEQISGFVDEGTGKTYGYHGYWARDWTAIDPNFGTMEEFKNLVKIAHAHDIRVLMDVVVNHTGPVTDLDSQWPEEWVRTGPQCTYQDMETTIPCTLVANLPDIRTEREEEVALPEFLLKKWEAEGRLEQELAELEEFFSRTGLPRAPRFYIMKWLTDYVREMGIDGYRVDTAKHTEASIWAELYRIAMQAFEDWKKANPAEVLDDQPFFMVGEVYGYSIWHGRDYPFNDTQRVDYFDNGFKSLINFSLRSEAGNDPEQVFSAYSALLDTALEGKTVLNYVASHDDGSPFDRNREKTFLAGTMLMLTPGQAQIYYGDELARPLVAEGAEGDAHLRTMMNWESLQYQETQDLLRHWQLLGQFRKAHPAVGAGKHLQISSQPYTFQRTLKSEAYEDKVLVVLRNDGSPVTVNGLFGEGTELTNYYSGEKAKVTKDQIAFQQATGLLLIAE